MCYFLLPHLLTIKWDYGKRYPYVILILGTFSICLIQISVLCMNKFESYFFSSNDYIIIFFLFRKKHYILLLKKGFWNEFHLPFPNHDTFCCCCHCRCQCECLKFFEYLTIILSVYSPPIIYTLFQTLVGHLRLYHKNLC